MEKQQQLRSQTDYPLANEPHFDEEWTLLTAKPVVPFSKLEFSTKRRTALKLAGAFAGALMLGALVALASIRLKRDSSNVALGANPVQDTQVAVNAAPLEEPAANAAEVVPENSDSLEATETMEAPTAAVVKAPIKVKVTPKRNGDKAEPQIVKEPESLESIAAEVLSQPTLTSEWQERRPRRVTLRRRRLQGHARNHRGLLRIDELFEGSQPSSPPE